MFMFKLKASIILCYLLRLAPCLPVVDLGYELHRASDISEVEGYYNFSNIRFASPPLGELRFQKPVPPVVNRSVIQMGSNDWICPQAQPKWLLESAKWILPYFQNGTMPNDTSWKNPPSQQATAPLVHHDPRESEDCLFLDVLVPHHVFGKAGKGPGAPVLVDIHGGGYVQGSKSALDPRGLLSRSRELEREGLIYIRINYRLGAFGFLAGPTVQKDGTANAGLYDQRMALQWVQDKIHVFGGDKCRVTVLGTSAGAGSLAHQITSFGGNTSTTLFQRAIVASPAWAPTLSPAQQEQTLKSFLKLAGARSLIEARTLNSKDLIHANALQITAASYGTFVYTPTIDGDLVQDDPKVLLKNGQFDRFVQVMIGHTPNEGLGFGPPTTTNSDYVQGIQHLYPLASPEMIQFIARTLYPPNLSSPLYSDHIRRMGLTVTEASFTCAVSALGRGFTEANLKSYGYILDGSFGTHGTDTPFIYYNAGTSTVNQTMAYALQNSMLTFAINGLPSSGVKGIGNLSPYGEEGKVLRIAATGISETVDPALNDRCKWWQLGLYGK